MKKMSIEEFFGKLDWEGGYPDLASYGIDPKEIADKKLAEAWKRYREQYKLLDKIADEIEAMRPEEQE